MSSSRRSDLNPDWLNVSIRQLIDGLQRDIYVWINHVSLQHSSQRSRSSSYARGCEVDLQLCDAIHECFHTCECLGAPVDVMERVDAVLQHASAAYADTCFRNDAAKEDQ
jgi:hypothetical protein